MQLSNEEIRRYSRHLILPEVGLPGQKKICSTSVLCIGAGGLGSPIAMYLAAAGIGKLGIVDFDNVDFSNLQRQILHTDADVGRLKSQSAKETVNGINPGVEVVVHNTRLTSANALEIIQQYDIVVDGTDNFPTRYLTNDACVLLRKPNVYGSIFRFEGQASVFAPHLGGPCYRCLYPEPPPPGMVPSCAEGGVLGVLPGIVGCIQATEQSHLVTFGRWLESFVFQSCEDKIVDRRADPFFVFHRGNLRADRRLECPMQPRVFGVSHRIFRPVGSLVNPRAQETNLFGA